MNHWKIIVNPNAGMQKASHDWKTVERLLKKYEVEFEVEFTQAKHHGIELTQAAIQQGFRNFAIVGGDGTLNEVVHGIFSQTKIPTTEFTVGVIPVGTGNDWCRMFDIPNDYSKAIKILKKRNIYVQDVGVVEYELENRREVRYFVNMTGMGYDAMVALQTNQQKDSGKANRFSYFLNIFSALFTYKTLNAKIIIDKQIFESELFSLNVGICKFNGGGMNQLPKAIADDGLLDLKLIQPIRKIDLLLHIRKLYTGNYRNLRQVVYFQGGKIEIHALGNPVWMEVDGESLGHSPFRFWLKEKALKIVRR